MNARFIYIFHIKLTILSEYKRVQRICYFHQIWHFKNECNIILNVKIYLRIMKNTKQSRTILSIKKKQKQTNKHYSRQRLTFEKYLSSVPSRLATLYSYRRRHVQNENGGTAGIWKCWSNISCGAWQANSLISPARRPNDLSSANIKWF